MEEEDSDKGAQSSLFAPISGTSPSTVTCLKSVLLLEKSF